MSGWMDQWMDRWVLLYGLVDECMVQWMKRYMDGWIDRYMNGGCMVTHRWVVDMWVGRWMDWWIDDGWICGLWMQGYPQMYGGWMCRLVDGYLHGDICILDGGWIYGWWMLRVRHRWIISPQKYSKQTMAPIIFFNIMFSSTSFLSSL